VIGRDAQASRSASRVGDEPPRLEIGLGDLLLADRRQRRGWTATGADYFCREPDAGFPELTDKMDVSIKPWKPR